MEVKLKELLERQTKLHEAEQSYVEMKKQLEIDIQKFISEHLGIAENEKFTMLDLINKAKR